MGDETDNVEAMCGVGVAAESVGHVLVGNGNAEMRVQWLGLSSLSSSSSSTFHLFHSCMHFTSLKNVWLVLGSVSTGENGVVPNGYWGRGEQR